MADLDRGVERAAGKVGFAVEESETKFAATERLLDAVEARHPGAVPIPVIAGLS